MFEVTDNDVIDYIGKRVKLNLKPDDHLDFHYKDTFGTIKYISEHGFVFEDDAGQDCFIDGRDYEYNLESVQTERDKLIDKAFYLLPKELIASFEWNAHAEKVITALHDAGMLKEPTND